MAKLKKSAIRPKVASDGACKPAGEGASSADGRKGNATTDLGKKGLPSMPAPPRPSGNEKRKKMVSKTAAGVLAAPTKSFKEKDSLKCKKTATAEQSVSGSSSSGNLTSPSKAVSDKEPNSEDEQETSVVPSEQRREKKRQQKAERVFTEWECLKQLAALSADDKRPPEAMTADMFASRFKLPHEGINTHRMKIGKDISLEEVEQVFGKEKSRNGFLLTEKLSKAMRRETQQLYCLCYQKGVAPNHVAKEFAISVVLDKVQHKSVDWADFASETNFRQRQSYCRRVKVWIEASATLRNVPALTVYESEGFTDYIFYPSDKSGIGDMHSDGALEGASVGLTKMRPPVLEVRGHDTETLHIRKNDVTNLVAIIESELQCLSQEIALMEADVKKATLEWEASSLLVKQIQSSLAEAEQECSVTADEEQIAAAVAQVGIGPMFKMFYSNVKKLSNYATQKSTCEESLNRAHAMRVACTTRLSTLQAYLKELSVGKDTVFMRPLPIHNNGEVPVVNNKAAALPSALVCCICSDGFPLWDIILCFCQHVYHPWCAIQWFQKNVTCAVPMCGLVSKAWYNSWDFGQYEKILSIHAGDINKDGESGTISMVQAASPQNTPPVSLNIGDGAPSLSACDSTFLKAFGTHEHMEIPAATTHLSTATPQTYIDGSNEPFGSKPATVEKKSHTRSPVTSSKEGNQSSDILPLTNPIAVTEVVCGVGPNWRTEGQDSALNLPPSAPLLHESPIQIVGGQNMECDEDGLNVMPTASKVSENADPLLPPTAADPIIEESGLQGSMGAEDPYSFTYPWPAKRSKKIDDELEHPPPCMPMQEGDAANTVRSEQTSADVLGHGTADCKETTSPATIADDSTSRVLRTRHNTGTPTSVTTLAPAQLPVKPKKSKVGGKK